MLRGRGQSTSIRAAMRPGQRRHHENCVGEQNRFLNGMRDKDRGGAAGLHKTRQLFLQHQPGLGVKGAPYKLILDRGIEKPGSGSMTIVASNAMHDAGYTAVDKAKLLKGKKIAIQAPGSIDQYLFGRAAEKAGLDPIQDLNWSSGMPYPDMIKLMGAGQADAANIPVPLAFLAEKNNAGKIIGAGSDIEPNAQLACWVMSSKFLAANKSAAVRFAMVHTHAGRLFNKAAAAKDADVIKIISDATKVPAPLIGLAAPRWTWFDEKGMPNVKSCVAQGAFWNKIKLVNATVTKEQLFDLSPAVEADARLSKSNPFT